MPFKANASRRHHIPKQRHRIRNWAEYDAGLRARGSLTVWFTPEAVARWRAETRTAPGGQHLYSDLAITTALTLRALFRLPLRQTEGLVGSIVQLLGVELAVPDHSTLSRRAKAVCLPATPASPGGAVQLLVDSTGVKLCGVAGREVWDPAPPRLEEAARRAGCRHRADRGGDPDRPRC
jgi:hypothetical protein